MGDVHAEGPYVYICLTLRIYGKLDIRDRGIIVFVHGYDWKLARASNNPYLFQDPVLVIRQYNNTRHKKIDGRIPRNCQVWFEY